MFERKSWLSAAALCVVLIAPFSGCSSGLSAGVPATRYVCSDDRAFDVIRTGQSAIVRLEGRDYSLQSKRGSLGDRFTGPSATLIIDGDFAAFVTDQEIGLSGCRDAGSV